MRYALFLIFLSIAGFLSGQQNPAFSERVEERQRLVTDEIENYPRLPVKNSAVLAAMRPDPKALENAKVDLKDQKETDLGNIEHVSLFLKICRPMPMRTVPYPLDMIRPFPSRL